MNLKEAGNVLSRLPPTPRQPVLFLGHGHPMNALWENAFTRRLSTLGGELPRPRAVMVVSAHWITPGSWVSSAESPETIHDFGRFDDRLFEIRYPAPGSPEMATAVRESAGGFRVREDDEMGLDHGAWSMTRTIWPGAEVPQFQLSVDLQASPAQKYELARLLRPLRDRGLLVVASGNVVHNLHRVAWNDEHADAPDWARDFDAAVKAGMEKGDDASLLDVLRVDRSARMAHPTADHYDPLIYALGLRHDDESPSWIHEGFQFGSISMRAARYG